GFLLEASAQLGRREQIGAWNFEGNFAAQSQVLSQKDDAVAAAAQLTANLKMPQTNRRADAISGPCSAGLRSGTGPVLAQQLHTSQVPFQALSDFRGSRQFRAEVDGNTGCQNVVVSRQSLCEMVIRRRRLVGIHGGSSISCCSLSIAL